MSNGTIWSRINQFVLGRDGNIDRKKAAETENRIPPEDDARDKEQHPEEVPGAGPWQLRLWVERLNRKADENADEDDGPKEEDRTAIARNRAPSGATRYREKNLRQPVKGSEN